MRESNQLPIVIIAPKKRLRSHSAIGSIPNINRQIDVDKGTDGGREDRVATGAIQCFVVLGLVDRGWPHDALEAVRPHVQASRSPSISDAALSPVEPISVLRSRDVVSTRLSAKVMARVNPNRARHRVRPRLSESSAS